MPIGRRSAAAALLLVILTAGRGAVADTARAPAPVFPGQHWQVAATPESRGWSSAKLAKARDFSATLATSAVMIVDDGVVVASWGDTAEKINVRSIRKSFLSALYGLAIARGQIRPEATLQDLGIDDNAPVLTELEKRARVIDLLKARSGIYHDALYETPGMKARKPVRGSHPPRSFWYYNNWDFNALGTIFEQRTGDSIYHRFEADIARPLGMEDYAAADQAYFSGPDSIHRAYPFRMSARDMARFGLLFLRDGSWNGRTVLPAGWVHESTTAYSTADGDAGYGYSGYGYLWWVAVNGNHLPNVEVPDGSFSARGAGGHYIVVIPQYHLVVVHRVRNEEAPGVLTDVSVSAEGFGRLLGLILAARET